MSMPRRGSRPITVDSTMYRWRIRRKETDSQRLQESNLTVSIEPVADKSITTLIVDTAELRGLASITPGLVEGYVRLALDQGWRPLQKGKPFILVATG